MCGTVNAVQILMVAQTSASKCSLTCTFQIAVADLYTPDMSCSANICPDSLSGTKDHVLQAHSPWHRHDNAHEVCCCHTPYQVCQQHTYTTQQSSKQSSQLKWLTKVLRVKTQHELLHTKHQVHRYLADLLEVSGDLLDSRTIPDLQHLYCRREGQCWQELGCQQKALWCAWLASTVHQLHEDLALIDGVHALVDFIYNPEWADSDILHQGHAHQQHVYHS